MRSSSSQVAQNSSMIDNDLFRTSHFFFTKKGVRQHRCARAPSYLVSICISLSGFRSFRVAPRLALSLSAARHAPGPQACAPRGGCAARRGVGRAGARRRRQLPDH